MADALKPLRLAWRRVRPLALAAQRRVQIRRERVLTTHYEGFTIHYPSLSIIGQQIASGKNWQGSLADVTAALFEKVPAPTVVEVGSNIGTSLIEIKRVRPAARVFCFEPSDRFADVLERNVAANRLGDVTIERLLVGSDDGSGQLFVNTSTASVAAPTYGGHDLLGEASIRMVALDSYFEPSATVDLLKIDTDGYDQAVVAGAQRLVRAHGPAIYCEFAPFLLQETGGSGEGFLALLESLGYHTIFPVLSGGQVLGAPLDHAGILRAAEEERYLDIVAVHDMHADRVASLRRLAEAGAA
jgi:FkbM family methyltransferase